MEPERLISMLPPQQSAVYIVPVRFFRSVIHNYPEIVLRKVEYLDLISHRQAVRLNRALNRRDSDWLPFGDKLAGMALFSGHENEYTDCWFELC
jgi:hypothetical protein